VIARPIPIAYRHATPPRLQTRHVRPGTPTTAPPFAAPSTAAPVPPPAYPDQSQLHPSVALLEARHAELVQALTQHDRRAADTQLRRLIELAQNVLWGHNLLEITVQYIAAGRELRRRAPPRVIRDPTPAHPYPHQSRHHPQASRGFSLPTILRPYPSQTPPWTPDQYVPQCPHRPSCQQAPANAPVRPPTATPRSADATQGRAETVTMPPPRRPAPPVMTATSRPPPAHMAAHRPQPANWAVNYQMGPPQQVPLRLSTRTPRVSEGEDESVTPAPRPNLDQDREFCQLIDTYRALNPGNLDQDPLLDIFVHSPPAQPQNPQ